MLDYLAVCCQGGQVAKASDQDTIAYSTLGLVRGVILKLIQINA